MQEAYRGWHERWQLGKGPALVILLYLLPVLVSTEGAREISMWADTAPSGSDPPNLTLLIRSGFCRLQQEY